MSSLFALYRALWHRCRRTPHISHYFSQLLQSPSTLRNIASFSYHQPEAYHQYTLNWSRVGVLNWHITLSYPSTEEGHNCCHWIAKLLVFKDLEKRYSGSCQICRSSWILLWSQNRNLWECYLSEQGIRKLCTESKLVINSLLIEVFTVYIFNAGDVFYKSMVKKVDLVRLTFLCSFLWKYRTSAPKWTFYIFNNGYYSYFLLYVVFSWEHLFCISIEY